MIHDVSVLLAASVSLEQLALAVLELVCSVYRLDAATFWQIEPGGHNPQCRATWCLPDEGLRTFISSKRRFNLGIELPTKVCVEQRVQQTSKVDPESGSDRHFAALQCGIRDAFVCPVRVGEAVVGAMELFSRVKSRLSMEFQETMECISSQIGQFVLRHSAEKDLLLRNYELKVVRRIQQGWQSKETPQIPGYDIAGESVPAHEVGGDFFDYVPMSTQRLGFVVGDAAGHGLDSALMIAEVRAYIRALAINENSLSRLFSLTNEYFIQHSEEGSLVTLLLARLNPGTGDLEFNSAGHLTGYVFDANGTVKNTMPSTGYPLGLISGAAFPPGLPRRLKPGEWVLMFTDGIVDARNREGERFGTTRLLNLARTLCSANRAREVITKLFAHIFEFTNNEFDDDMTAILIIRHL